MMAFTWGIVLYHSSNRRNLKGQLYPPYDLIFLDICFCHLELLGVVTGGCVYSSIGNTTSALSPAIYLLPTGILVTIYKYTSWSLFVRIGDGRSSLRALYLSVDWP